MSNRQQAPAAGYPSDNVIPFQRVRRSETENDATSPAPCGPRILVATDLSACCERALGRAAALSKEWKSKLSILHVVETAEQTAAHSSDALQSARSRPWKSLLAQVAGVSKAATILVQEGDPAREIRRIAAVERCDMIILGSGRRTVLGRMFLTRTIDRILRFARVPVLIVKESPHRPYSNIVVATDFSAASRNALEITARSFPERRPTVFHAHEGRPSFLKADGDGNREASAALIQQRCEDFVARSHVPADWRPKRLLWERGAPDRLLRDFVEDDEVDLVVLGMPRRWPLSELLLGSSGRAIADDVACDVLVVPYRSHA